MKPEVMNKPEWLAGEDEGEVWMAACVRACVCVCTCVRVRVCMSMLCTSVFMEMCVCVCVCVEAASVRRITEKKHTLNDNALIIP